MVPERKLTQTGPAPSPQAATKRVSGRRAARPPPGGPAPGPKPPPLASDLYLQLSCSVLWGVGAPRLRHFLSPRRAHRSPARDRRAAERQKHAAPQLRPARRHHRLVFFLGGWRPPMAWLAGWQRYGRRRAAGGEQQRRAPAAAVAQRRGLTPVAGLSAQSARACGGGEAERASILSGAALEPALSAHRRWRRSGSTAGAGAGRGATAGNQQRQRHPPAGGSWGRGAAAARLQQMGAGRLRSFAG